MAALFRFRNSSAIKKIIQPAIINRTISTSKKNSDTAATVIKEQVSACETPTTKKNWVSYGFETTDETADRRATHSIFFFSVTLCMVIGGFVWAYIPDYQLRDWAQREAFLELRRRERDGLPLLDPNLIDPSQVALPDDEELGDTEIII